MGGSWKLVKECPSKGYPFLPYRMGKNPTMRDYLSVDFQLERSPNQEFNHSWKACLSAGIPWNQCSAVAQAGNSTAVRAHRTTLLTSCEPFLNNEHIPENTARDPLDLQLLYTFWRAWRHYWPLPIQIFPYGYGCFHILLDVIQDVLRNLFLNLGNIRLSLTQSIHHAKNLFRDFLAKILSEYIFKSFSGFGWHC
jgi:hypothetical protein